MVDRKSSGGSGAAGPDRPRQPLRGRSAELARAIETLRGARLGQPAMLVISGEAGIGKTALTRAVTEQAVRQGFVAAHSTAHETDKVTPLASLAPGLRFGADPLISSADFMELAQLHEQPLWLVERLATLLEARADHRPLLLVVDDAQWVDPLTRFALRLLPGRLVASPLVWLLATRDLPGGPADQAAEAALAAVPVVRIALAALSDGAVLEMAADRFGPDPDPALVRQLTGVHGNPFLAAQVLDGLFAPDAADPSALRVPTGLVEGVRRRVAATSGGCRDLVRMAAVLGPECLLTDIARLLDTTAGRLTDPLTEAMQAGLLADDGSSVRFRHELLRDAVYEDIPPSGRRAHHRAITEHFLATGRGPAAAAPHVLAIAEPGDALAVDLLREAAHEVVATMATTSATFIRQAFDLTAADDPRRPQIGAEVVRFLVAAHQYTNAAAFADDLLARVTDPDLVATMQLTLMPRLWATEALAELANRAGDLRTAGASAGPTARLAAYRALAGTPTSAAWASTGSTESAADSTRTSAAPSATEALALAERTGDATATVLAHAALAGEAERRGEYLAAHRAYARAQVVETTALGAAGAPVPGQLELRALMARARLDGIEAELSKLSDVQPGDRRFPVFWQAPQLAWVRAFLCLGAGRLDDAATHATQSLQLMEDVGDPAFDRQVRHLLVEVALLRGDRGAARAQLALAEKRGVELPVARALYAEAEDGPQGAAALIHLLAADSAGDRAAETTWAPWPDQLLVQAACSARHTGDEETLRAAGERMSRLASGALDVTSIQAAALLVRGRSGDEFGAAVELLHNTSRTLLLAHAEEEYGRSGLADGDRPTALASLDRARDLFAATGASSAAARVQRILQAAGVRRRRWPAAPERPADGWGALTDSERRVALLVADGHTNRSAATELMLSPSTISTHLRSVFTKLDVHSRVQLAKVVLRHDA